VPSSSYDVIVLGDDLAGLVAATLCARRGLRVLVTATAPPEPYTMGPYTLPRTVLPFVGESSPALRRVVAELNFIQLVRRRLTLLRPSFQVVLPDARIQVGPDADALGRELQRELPDERPALEGFLARAAEVSRVLEPILGQDVSFPPEGFWERREIARSDGRLPAPDEDLLPGVAAGHRARALAALPAALSLPCDPRALTPTAICRAFDLWRRGAARFEGGGDALRQLFLDKLRTQHAGEVRTVAPAALSMKWGRAHGLVLAERDEALGCGHLIWAAPAAELLDLVGARGPKRLVALARAIRPTAYRFVLNVVLSGAGVAEGLAPVNFVVVDPAAPLVGDNAFALHVADPDDGGRVVVTLVANAPEPGDGQILTDVLGPLKARLLERLEEVMPFSAEHILLAHSPNLAAPDGPAPVPPEPLWSSTLQPSLGVGALPYDVGVKAATPASSQSLVGLGLEGQFVAGWCAARIVSGAAGKKKDYLKDEVLLGT
jgi:hypothetical protein